MPVEETYLPDPVADPEQEAMSHERRGQLARAVGRLKPMCKQLLKLQLEHNSLKTVSQLLKAPEGTIYSRWSRCRQDLRKLMEQEKES